MYKLLSTIIAIMCFGNIQIVARQDSTINDFMYRNPNVMKVNMLQDETLHMVSDGNQMLLMLDICNPHLLLRFVMEGFSLYIDPTGRKKEKYEILMPSVADLDKEALGLKRGDSDNVEVHEEKPNILPLMKPLCDHGILFTRNNRKIYSEELCFSMFLDVKTDHLYYYILFPIDVLMKEKKLSPEWSVGVFAPQVEMPDPNEGQMMPPPQKMDDRQMPESFTAEISQWIPFSFERICSLNN